MKERFCSSALKFLEDRKFMDELPTDPLCCGVVTRGALRTSSCGAAQNLIDQLHHDCTHPKPKNVTTKEENEKKRKKKRKNNIA